MNEVLQKLMTNCPTNLTELDTDGFEKSRADAYNAIAGKLGYIDCPICRNKGDVAEVLNGRMVIVPCKCIQSRRSAREIEQSGLKSAIQFQTFDNFRTDYNWQAGMKSLARDYADVPKGWMVVSGQSGCGKTHICTAVCGELMKKFIPLKYFLWRTEAPALKAYANTPEYSEKIQPWKDIKCLYIDDFFKGRVTYADVSLAFDLINARYIDPDKLTIISSELSIEEIMKIDGAIGGRIYERSRGQYINLSGADKNMRVYG